MKKEKLSEQEIRNKREAGINLLALLFSVVCGAILIYGFVSNFQYSGI